MDTTTLLSIFQIIVSVLLIVVILLQRRGAGMGALFGGEGAVYQTKRGPEKFLFWATIVLAALFMAFSLLQFFA